MKYFAIALLSLISVSTFSVEASKEDDKVINGILDMLYNNMPAKGINLPNTLATVKGIIGINLGSIALKNTTIHGLENFILAESVQVTKLENGPSVYHVKLRIENATLTTVMHPDLAVGPVKYNSPFGANITIHVIPLRFDLTMTGTAISVFNIPSVSNFSMSKFQNVAVHLAGSGLIKTVAERVSSVLISHVNENIYQKISNVFQRQLTAVMKDPYKFMG